MNIPPDKRGLFHENDVNSLYGFRALLKTEFAINLAAKAKTTADNYRGRQKQFAPLNLTDGNKETYWATDDNVTKASIEISFNKTSMVKYILLQEYIKLGQRVKLFTVEVWKDNDWKKVAEATTIGYKRILKIEPVVTDKIRISILDAKACPVLSNIEVY